MLYALEEMLLKLNRMMRLSHLVVIFVVVCLGLGLSPASASLINPRTTLQCHVRSYSFRATKPPIVNENGDLVTCEGEVHVNSCWGRCDSSEIGDFKMPFKVSRHPVCTYTGRVVRTVTLSECQGYPGDPTIEVFDAAGCACRLCDSDFTSCENLNG
ncbi:thyrostimulin beta-5 subunit-like [Littorina saxatilis]|uniref:Glycoprotein hormone subunit beta domain-containing protein n=1 Tax=Littorina saxatilis TaxID=31220 RepID=A0AAN9BDQ1_9CAEN